MKGNHDSDADPEREQRSVNETSAAGGITPAIVAVGEAEDTTTAASVVVDVLGPEQANAGRRSVSLRPGKAGTVAAESRYGTRGNS